MTSIRKMNSVAILVSIAFAFALLTGSYAFAHGNGDGHDEVEATVDATCMQTAVETREDALMSSWEDFNTSIVAGLTARKTALKVAWGLSDKKAQKKAIVTAMKEWKTESKEAHATLKTERKAAWSTFKETAKETCGMAASKDEVLGKDAAGTIAL